MQGYSTPNTGWAFPHCHQKRSLSGQTSAPAHSACLRHCQATFTIPNGGITARLSRLCLKPLLPRGLQPTAAQTRDERLSVAKTLAHAACSAAKERRSEYAPYVYIQENIDPTMAHKFSLTATVPTHLKLCLFTQTIALQDDATLRTCFARLMTQRGMYSWHQAKHEVL